MHQLLLTLLLLRIVLLTDAQTPAPPPASASSAAAAADWAGDWGGTLDAGVARMPIVFHISAEPQGGYAAKMDSPEQNVMGIPVTATRIAGRRVTMTIGNGAGVYKGEIAPDGRTIQGTWAQGGRKYPLELTRGVVAAPPKRPQEPKPPFPYDSEDVTFKNAAGGHALAGTLTMPKTGRPLVAVVMITGSGPQDRDSTISAHKPFWVLADQLAREGIAALRYDDRGIGKSGGDFGSAKTSDFASDAAAAVAYLKSRPEIDQARIGVLGHSEGGLAAPIAAADSRDVSFVVLLAAPAVPGEKVIYRQTEAILHATGQSHESIVRGMGLQKALFTIVRESSGIETAVEPLTAALREYYDETPPAERAQLGERDKFVSSQLATVNNEWFRHFLTFDPRPTIARLKCPVLALTGEKDLQVIPSQNLPEIEKALQSAGNTRVTIRELPGLNHLFQHAKTGAPTEYGEIEETLSPEVPKLIAEWIRSVTSQ